MLCFIFAALVVILDQFFKHWIVLTLEVQEQVDLIPGVIGLTHIENPGAAFSILANQRWLLAGIAFVAAIILIFILLRYTDGFLGTIGLAAVLGGTVGNLIDRVFNDGKVVDMFQPLFVEFAVFNIADIFLTLGFITFCVQFIITSIKAPKLKVVQEEGEEGDEIPEYEQYEDSGEEDPYSIYDIPDTRDIPDFDEYSDAQPVSAAREDRYPAGREDRYPAGAADSYAQTAGAADSYAHPAGAADSYSQAAGQQNAYPSAPAYESFFEPEPLQTDNYSSALGALEDLESELGSIDDYDADALLRAYGFEDSND